MSTVHEADLIIAELDDDDSTGGGKGDHHLDFGVDEHDLDDDDGGPLALSPGRTTKRARTDDININDEDVDEIDHDSDGSDAYVEPSLRKVRQKTQNPPVLRSSASAFAHNTGPFLALHPTSSTADSTRLTVSAAADSSDVNLTSMDYTHISQALAHQPLATNPSQQTIEMMQKLGTAEADSGSLEDKMSRFMTEVKSQLYGLSQRIDYLETARFSSSASIASLQTSISNLEARLPSSTDLLGSTSRHLSSTVQASPIETTPPVAGPSSTSVSEAANAQSAGAMAALVNRHLSEISGGQLTTALNHDALSPDFFTQTLNYDLSSAVQQAQAHAGQIQVPDVKPKKGSGGKKATSTKKAEGGTPEVKTKRARKPELSRAVRAAMFKLLGLPIAANASKYHGYTSQPELPDFSPTIAFDPLTGARLWRWEWDKTLRQSAYNAAFSMAIQNQVLSERDQQGQHQDVPEADWAFLEDAVDSAYTNLRRERDSQVDPMKKLKKDEHRKRGKKRGLKEEKSRRRLKAYQEGSISHGGGDTATPSMGWINMIADLGGESLETALELKYMSSEDEIDTNDPEWLARTTPDVELASSSTTMCGSEKTFYVHRPAWRSDKIANAYAQLDSLKPPERAYKRLLGPPRQLEPPAGTPDWMLNDPWKSGIPVDDLPGVARAALAVGTDKGKKKAS
ncbi:hypothetical protein MNV49_007147 [Pseudohyphozyma bogoriensis]|nr:hypothetical protein MNV49_007147 [Pseudohyphozyma bogoriensis]